MIHERKPVFVNSPAHAEVMRAVAISNNELLDNKISSIIKIGEVLTHERFFSSSITCTYLNRILKYF